MLRNSHKKCAISLCPSYATKDVSLYAFPKDPEMCEKWKNILKIKRPFSRHWKVCSNHFAVEDFIITSSLVRIKRLRKDALPKPFTPDCDNFGLSDMNNIHNKIETSYMKQHPIPFLGFVKVEESKENSGNKNLSVTNSEEDVGIKEEIIEENSDDICFQNIDTNIDHPVVANIENTNIKNNKDEDVQVNLSNVSHLNSSSTLLADDNNLVCGNKQKLRQNNDMGIKTEQIDIDEHPLLPIDFIKIEENRNTSGDDRLNHACVIFEENFRIKEEMEKECDSDSSFQNIDANITTSENMYVENTCAMTESLNRDEKVDLQVEIGTSQSFLKIHVSHSKTSSSTSEHNKKCPLFSSDNGGILDCIQISDDDDLQEPQIPTRTYSKKSHIFTVDLTRSGSNENDSRTLHSININKNVDKNCDNRNYQIIKQKNNVKNINRNIRNRDLITPNSTRLRNKKNSDKQKKLTSKIYKSKRICTNISSDFSTVDVSNKSQSTKQNSNTSLFKNNRKTIENESETDSSEDSDELSNPIISSVNKKATTASVTLSKRPENEPRGDNVSSMIKMLLKENDPKAQEQLSEKLLNMLEEDSDDDNKKQSNRQHSLSNSQNTSDIDVSKITSIQNKETSLVESQSTSRLSSIPDNSEQNSSAKQKSSRSERIEGEEKRKSDTEESNIFRTTIDDLNNSRGSSGEGSFKSNSASTQNRLLEYYSKNIEQLISSKSNSRSLMSMDNNTSSTSSDSDEDGIVSNILQKKSNCGAAIDSSTQSTDARICIKTNTRGSRNICDNNKKPSKQHLAHKISVSGATSSIVTVGCKRSSSTDNSRKELPSKKRICSELNHNEVGTSVQISTNVIETSSTQIQQESSTSTALETITSLENSKSLPEEEQFIETYHTVNDFLNGMLNPDEDANSLPAFLGQVYIRGYESGLQEKFTMKRNQRGRGGGRGKCRKS